MESCYSIGSPSHQFYSTTTTQPPKNIKETPKPISHISPESTKPHSLSNLLSIQTKSFPISMLTNNNNTSNLTKTNKQNTNMESIDRSATAKVNR